STHDEYEPIDKRLSNFMKAMAHPARVAIMIKLATTNRCIEGEVIDGLPLSNSVVAKHLYALQQAGLIKGTTTAIRSYYCINWDAFWEFSDNFQGIFKDFQNNAVAVNCDSKRSKKLLVLPFLISLTEVLQSSVIGI
ncbi:MAG: ArsR/SmtB family transcription factor, partial [Daejeonella sp.]